MGDPGTLRAVGWLDVQHPFAKGSLDDEFFSRLFTLTENAWEPCHFMGYHRCELCADPPFATDVELDGRRFTMPSLVVS